MSSTTRLLAPVFALAAAACMEPPDTVDDQSGVGVDNRYIVILAGDADELPTSVAARHAAAPIHVYTHAPREGGFSAALTEAQVAALRDDPAVWYVVPDKEVTHYAQTVPTGIRRIEADVNPVAAIDGVDVELDIDIAVVDTGIRNDHPDLNVVGGANFSSGPADKWDDGEGHGTHVSGIIAARDNDIGVVGVAPGARLWAVRVLNNAGSGFNSDVIDGVDWVTANAATIEVANMSLGGPGSDDGMCGTSASDPDPLHTAICDAVAAGVTFVVAAGNEDDDAANHTPAAYDEVITVAALSDGDGQSGGLGTIGCRTDTDDTLANFSNWGPDVDLIAPGVCIYSTGNGGGGPFGGDYVTVSGTSQASPHVAGVAALYLLRHPGADPATVRQALIDRARAKVCPTPDGSCTNATSHTVAEPLAFVGHLDESFDTYGTGAAPAEYVFNSSGDAFVDVTAADKIDGPQSAALGVATDTGADDYSAVTLCGPELANDHFKATLSLRFDGLVNYNGIGISGTTSPLLYWWWINQSGTVYDDQIVGSVASTWQTVEIEVDRVAGTATFGVDGAGTTSLLSTWGSDDTEPMDCLRIGSGVDLPQTIYVDDVVITSDDEIVDTP